MNLHEAARGLHHRDAAQRRDAVRSLSHVADLWALHSLTAVRDHDPVISVRRLAAAARAQCENALVRQILPLVPRTQETSGSTVFDVVAAFRDGSPRVRRAGVVAAAVAGNLGYLDAIHDLLRHETDASVVVGALKALGRLGGKREAVEVLRFTRHADARIRGAALIALSMFGAGFAWVLLARVAAAATGRTRNEALFFLSLLGEARLHRILGWMAASQEEAVALAALDTCSLLGQRSFLALVEGARTHPLAAVRARAEALKGAETDPEPEVHAEPEPVPDHGGPPVAPEGPLLTIEAVRDVLSSTSSESAAGLVREAPPPDTRAEDEDDGDRGGDEIFREAKEQLLSASMVIPAGRPLRGASASERFGGALAAVWALSSAVLLYGGALAALAAPLLAVQRAVAAGLGSDPWAVGPPIIALPLVVWLLVPTGRLRPWVTVGARDHPHALRSVAAACGKVGAMDPDLVVLEPDVAVELQISGPLPLIPLARRNVLVLGALLLETLSGQELKALVAQTMARAGFERGAVARFVRQAASDFVRLEGAYRVRGGPRLWLNPVAWFLAVAHGGFLALGGPRLRASERAADVLAAAACGSNVLRDALVQRAVSGRLATTAAREILDGYVARLVRPANVLAEVDGVLERMEPAAKGRAHASIMAAAPDGGATAPTLRERIAAITGATPRRTRVRRSAWRLFEGPADLQRRLTAFLWHGAHR